MSLLQNIASGLRSLFQRERMDEELDARGSWSSGLRAKSHSTEFTSRGGKMYSPANNSCPLLPIITDNQ
jgi:hypothetical protein